MAKPAVGVAESLGALEDGTGVHIDEVRRQVLGQTLEPLPLVGDEDRDHELIYPIGDGFGTTAQWHGEQVRRYPSEQVRPDAWPRCRGAGSDVHRRRAPARASSRMEKPAASTMVESSPSENKVASRSAG